MQQIASARDLLVRPVDDEEKAIDRTEQDDVAEHRHDQERRTEQDSSEAAPECTELAEELRAVAGIEVADDVLFAVVILADDGKLAHRESAALQRFDCVFCLLVGRVDADCDVFVVHGCS